MQSRNSQIAPEEISHVGLVGIGAVGSALARNLAGSGYQISALIDINKTKARKLAQEIAASECAFSISAIGSATKLLIVAVQDSDLLEVDRLIADSSAKLNLQACVHTSGALPGSILQDVKRNGIEVGSFHPLQTFTVDMSPSLKGVYFAIQGSEAVLGILDRLVNKLGGIPVVCPEEDKVIYHAGAVFASNFIPVLLRASVDLFGDAGISPDTARKMISPLVKESLRNCLRKNEAKALTGPVARGDASTVSKHLDALVKQNPSLQAIYRMLSLKALELAAEEGLAEEKIDTVYKILTV